MKPWRPIESRLAHRCGIFDLNHVRFRPPDGRAENWFYVIDAPEWINVIPITDDDEIVFVRQYRFGIDDLTLEIPGGMCDPGEPPFQAAGRELLEETGYAAEALTEVGWVHPNPPIQNNRCHTYLARGVKKVAEPSPDAHEALEVELIARREIRTLFQTGRITHALVLAAFQLWDGL